ncbi:MAG: RNA polymerase subunit sigma-70 [Bacteroidetes bacterium MedPE-SWsnd-G1]|nr:MAG: RNA polymerase subunit sigma-70 [Bacteroidetes bacterium MedPE-SWsnd-G1]
MTTQHVWNTYSKDVFSFIYSKVKNRTLSDDLTQETFLKVHTKLDTLKDASKLKSWVFSIARNTVLDHFRNSKLESDTPIFEIEDDSEELEHTEKDCLLSHIMNLDKKYRTPLFLADVKGIKQQEIANQLNLALPTVKSRIQRARKKVAEGYMDCCGYELNEKGVLVGEMKNRDECKICR